MVWNGATKCLLLVLKCHRHFVEHVTKRSRGSVDENDITLFGRVDPFFTVTYFYITFSRHLVFLPILFPESLFPLTNGRKTRAPGATISGMCHRCRLAVKLDGRNHQNSVISKWLLSELSFSDHWSRGTKTLGARLSFYQCAVGMCR